MGTEKKQKREDARYRREGSSGISKERGFVMEGGWEGEVDMKSKRRNTKGLFYPAPRSSPVTAPVSSV